MGWQTPFDLNALMPASPGPRKAFDWSATSRTTVSGSVTVHLGDVATPLAAFLHDSESVVGCVAWITSTRLVDELLGKPVSFIVNKEFSLRKTDTKPAATRNQANLARLTGGLRRRDFAAPLNHPAADNDVIDPVRCSGQTPSAKYGNSPLLHHKFVVRLSAGKPVAVWTGSFNFTRGAESNFETAIEVNDPAIAAAYLAEWERVAAVSEPLEFLAGKAAPNWGGKRRTAAAAKPPSAVKKAVPVMKAVVKKPAVPKTAVTKASAAVAAEAPRRRRPARKQVTKRIVSTAVETEQTPLKRAVNAGKRKPVVRAPRTPRRRRTKKPGTT